MNLIITPIFIAGIIFMVILWLAVMWWLLMQLIGVGVYLFGLLADIAIMFAMSGAEIIEIVAFSLILIVVIETIWGDKR